MANEAQALLFLGGRSNQVYGPGFQRLDASIFKHFITYKEQFVELRVDAFNVANTPSYGIPASTGIGTGGGLITSHRKGQIRVGSSSTEIHWRGTVSAKD